MKNTLTYTCIILLVFGGITACKKKGCTDPLASNYNENATKDNGNCKYDTSGTIAPASTERISYGADSRQHYDLYLPEGHDENTKTVVLIHGGAWVLGPLASDEVLLFGELGLNLTNKLLDQDYAVAIMKYRLACYTEDVENLSGDPNLYMNQQLTDVELALDKLKTDAVTAGYSPNDFALLGESAGAHIALMYGLKNTDPLVKTVVSFYGPTEMDDEAFKTNANTYPNNSFTVSSIFALNDFDEGCDIRTTGNMSLYWALNTLTGTELEFGSTQPTFTDVISPAHPANLVNNIPVFLLHGENDALVPNEHADYLMTELNAKFGTTPAPTADFTGQHKLKKYSNCGHGWSGGSCNKTQIRNDVVSWLAVHF